MEQKDFEWTQEVGQICTLKIKVLYTTMCIIHC
ncbi:MAG: hypothetical protein ACJARP_003184 [Vicingaceae bacterium]|jgi:hypothetical protein